MPHDHAIIMLTAALALQFQGQTKASLVMVANNDVSRHSIWYRLLCTCVDMHFTLKPLPPGEMAGCNLDVHLRQQRRWPSSAATHAALHSGLQLDTHLFAKVTDRGITFYHAG